MVKFQNIFNRYLFFGLFVLAAMSFIVTLQGDNDAAQPLGSNTRFASVFSNLTDAINASDNESRTQYGIFVNEQPKVGFGSIVLFGIVAVGRTTGQIITTFFTIVIGLPLVILQIPASIFSIIVVWMSISLVIGLWLLYKLGG